MKKIITLLAILYVINVFATDRLVNPNLSQGNGTTIFTTITSAVAAAVNGDRIIVVSSTYNEAELTIDKSLQIIPQTAGTVINFNANIIISGFAGMTLEISGFDLGAYDFKTLDITNGNYNNRAKVFILNSKSFKVLFNKDFYECILINNYFDGYIAFKHGSVFRNTAKHILLIDEFFHDNNQNIGIKNKIIQNDVSFLIGVFNNDYPFIIANNTFRDLSIKRWSVADNVKNEIINNTIKDNASFNVSHLNVPKYNLIFSNNLFQGTYYHLNAPCGDAGGENYNHITISSYPDNYNNALLGFTNDPFDGAYSLWFHRPNSSWGDEFNNPTRPASNGCFLWVEQGTATNTFPKLTVPGFVEWTYNGIKFDCNSPDSSSKLTITLNLGPNDPIDGGNPNHKYYDIDLTINDRGINGGPYSKLNYNAANPKNSRAFIFDLEMPADLFPGQNIEIKAKGYHKN
jgi:hypothetical protein